MNGEKAIVFISCGQSSAEEILLGNKLAEAVDSLTEHKGYFAEQVSSLDALSNNILSRLNECVAFVAVLHHRGEVATRHAQHVRGSVWVEQEIAVAAFITQVLKRNLAVRLYVQKGIKREGIRDQLQLNPLTFLNNDEVVTDFRTWLGEQFHIETPTRTRHKPGRGVERLAYGPTLIEELGKYYGSSGEPESVPVGDKIFDEDDDEYIKRLVRKIPGCSGLQSATVPEGIVLGGHRRALTVGAYIWVESEIFDATCPHDQ